MTKKEGFYAEELKRKDKLIEDLKAQNKILLESSLKRSEELEETKMHLRKLMDINSSLIKKKKV